MEIDTFGKIQPQATDLEIAVLGACLIDNTCPLIVVGILKPEHFYANHHQLIYSSIVRLFAKNEPIDILTVTEDLKTEGSLGQSQGAAYISELTNRIASAANAEYHCRIIKQKWIQRQLIKITLNQLKTAYDDTTDVIEQLGSAANEFTNLINEVASGSVKPFVEIVDETFEGMAKAALKKADEKYIIGKSTGVYELDLLTLGYNDSDFIVLSGRPKDGKSTLAITGVLQNAKKGIPSGLFTLEMSKEQIVLKMAAMETGIDIQILRAGRATKEQWKTIHEAQAYIRELPVYVYDKRGLYVSEVIGVAKGWKSKYGVQWLALDYVQLLKSEDKKLTREQEISHISRQLKQLAGDLNAPVVAVAALSRALESRAGWDKRPKDSDLREGGSLEYDPDMIIHVFRPENHGLSDRDGEPTNGMIELIVSKNRLGSLGIVRKYIEDSTGILGDVSVKNYKVINHYEKDETPF